VILVGLVIWMVIVTVGLFLPALDAQGKPRPAQFRSRLSWAIE
jgi:hypothetical protein